MTSRFQGEIFLFKNKEKKAMKLEFIIKNLIQNSKIRTQSELNKILEKKGLSTTQSNISRILKKINTVKLIDENKETYYVIRSKPLEITSPVRGLALNIETNGYSIVIKTYPGAAGLVGQIIDERNIENVMAAVAGNNVVLIAPNDVKNIEILLSKLKALFVFTDEK
jgi:transcriptional regulator of arginine metabolism